ncbi:class I SAM-dependent methyltransferase [Bremerella cremea]|uniref:class I SAM-dependent methyltransferase n=1 Tax=Bremerella cremea TaxID=1031537 RepID=UPI0031EC5E47
MAHRVFQSWNGCDGEIGLEISAQSACPISGTYDGVVVYNRDRYGFPMRTVISKATGLVYTDPRPADDAIDDFYRNGYRRFYKSAPVPKWKHTARNARIAGQRMDVIQSLTTKGSTVLDVGTGSGELLYVGRRAGLEMQGIEADQAYAQFGRRSYGVKIINQSLQRARLPEAHFDVVTIYHVLEHLADPTAALKKLATALKPGGHLVIEVPNVDSLDAQFRQKWHPGHLFHFNCATLSALANVCGFEVVTVYTCDRLSVVWAILKKPEVAVDRRWPYLIEGNFDHTWQILQSQARQSWMTNLKHKFMRNSKKLQRNLHEWISAMSEPSHRKLVDKVSRRKAA